MRQRVCRPSVLFMGCLGLIAGCVGSIAGAASGPGFGAAVSGRLSDGSRSATGGQRSTASPDAKKLKSPVPATPESIAAGQRTYQKFCRFCHGDDGRGNGPMAPEGTHPSNLVDEKWQRGSTDGEIYTTIRDGVGPKFDMKAYRGKLTDQDIWNVVNYLRSLGPKAK